ncbi:hypothetical protein [Neorhodopirellula pilleata]|uniref:Uncharacterized protein n=1 Tax=Neorhodopirellula pilleata TaxID=2714738 RepID=A0A5C6A896_9BACT|nr:hypothetical protein [Neorhodopirellula pilleata]TWT95535.1 hypothetical protein Pla100_31760 [Neorhodopirellula pilleata]
MTKTYKRWLSVAAVACGLTFGSMAPVNAGCFSDLFASNACDDACCDLGISDLNCCEPDCGCETGCCEPQCGCETQCGCDTSCGDCDLLCCDSATCCDSGCDAAGGFGCCSALDSFASKLTGLGCIQPSDKCFDDFISPMIDFVHFEDPRNLTELRPIFVHHRFPNELGPLNVPAGGSLQLFALQFRIALTDRLSLIAVKDGYAIDNSEGDLDTALLNSGWADVTAGLKYNLVRNVKTGTLLSAGFTYEIPLGSKGTLQAVGDGQFHFFATGGQRLLDGRAHVLSSFGWQLPVDQSVQSTTVHWNNHLDVKVTDRIYLFTENSWWHWVDDANVGNAFGVSGLDLLNLGDTAVEGNDVVTHNVGAKFKPKRNIEAGMAYEFPLTDFEDIIRDRWTFDFIVRY